jgi:transposase-like protein
MVAEVTSCPFCQRSDAVVRHGTNRGGTARCRCRTCERTFTPRPNPRLTTTETEEAILRCLGERLSIEATARLLHVSKATIYKTLKKIQHPSA